MLLTSTKINQMTVSPDSLSIFEKSLYILFIGIIPTIFSIFYSLYFCCVTPPDSLSQNRSKFQSHMISSKIKFTSYYILLVILVNWGECGFISYFFFKRESKGKYFLEK